MCFISSTEEVGVEKIFTATKPIRETSFLGRAYISNTPLLSQSRKVESFQ